MAHIGPVIVAVVFALFLGLSLFPAAGRAIARTISVMRGRNYR